MYESTNEVNDKTRSFVVRFPVTEHIPYGGVAQLGEHLPCKQGVRGSIPLISTKENGEGTGRDSNKRISKKRF